MKVVLIGIGVLAASVLALVAVPLGNFVLGPSPNTLHMCKELEMEGYLADECFDWVDGFPWAKAEECKRAKK
jgi:hypothetical protein